MNRSAAIPQLAPFGQLAHRTAQVYGLAKTIVFGVAARGNTFVSVTGTAAALDKRALATLLRDQAGRLDAEAAAQDGSLRLVHDAGKPGLAWER